MANEKIPDLLHDAVKSGRIKIVEEMLELGANVNKDNDDLKSTLHIAVEEKNIEMVKFLLSQGAKVDSEDAAGRTALNYALALDQLEIADFLMKSGSDINYKSAKGEKALLHDATQTNNLQMVKSLLSRGADINSKTEEGETALHVALKADNHDVAEFLIEAGIDLNCRENTLGWSALHLVTLQNKNVSLVKKLLSRGAKIDIKDSQGMTALCRALLNGDLEMSDILLDAGADVNSQDEEGNTALHSAATSNAEKVQYLLSRNANVNITNFKGETALHIAIRAGKFVIADLLIDSGIDINCKKTSEGYSALHLLVLFRNNAYLVEKLISLNVDVHSKDNSGFTALSIALAQGALDLADLIIEAGGNVNSQSNNGSTALHLSITDSLRETDGVTLTKALLARGVDVNVQNSNGQTALHLALASDQLDIAKCFVETGAEVKCQDENNNTALHLASCKYDDASIVQDLLSKGADINVKNNKGQTPLHLAVIHKKPAVIQKLLFHGADRSIVDKEGETAIKKALKLGDCHWLISNVKVDGNGFFQDPTFKQKPKKNILSPGDFENFPSLAYVGVSNVNNKIEFSKAERLLENGTDEDDKVENRKKIPKHVVLFGVGPEIDVIQLFLDNSWREVFEIFTKN